MPSQRLISRVLARSFVCTNFDYDSLLVQGQELCGERKQRWLTSLCSYLEKHHANSRPTEAEVTRAIQGYPAFQNAWSKGKIKLTKFFSEQKPQMRPFPGAPETWNVPSTTGFAQLASLLNLHPDDLGWLTSYSRRFKHYHYSWHGKRSKISSSSQRLIEAPKPLLKLAQRRVLQRILQQVPVHESAMAFRTGKSVHDFVRPHAKRRIVLKLDLEDFFPSIRFARVFQIFLSMGYPESVAKDLSRLCTHSVAADFVSQAGSKLSFESKQRLIIPHLPQGAPTSPALANLSAFRMDCRLSGLAKAAGACYTRYADDLLFSGDENFARQSKRFYTAAAAIILSEGFQPNYRKTRFFYSGQRQRAAGLVMNQKPNISRADYDRLKAILTNCRIHGPESQNHENHPEFRSHLLGRISWVRSSNNDRAEKLQALFDAISWD